MGHEYCGIVEEIGSAVTTIKPGQFVIGSFFASDNTCPHCRGGYQSSCQHRELVGTAQAPILRVPLADGTLVTTPEVPNDELIPSLLREDDAFDRHPSLTYQKYPGTALVPSASLSYSSLYVRPTQGRSSL